MPDVDVIREALAHAERPTEITLPHWHWGVVTGALRAEARRHAAIANRAKHGITKQSNNSTAETMREIANAIDDGRSDRNDEEE